MDSYYNCVGGKYVRAKDLRKKESKILFNLFKIRFSKNTKRSFEINERMQMTCSNP